MDFLLKYTFLYISLLFKITRMRNGQTFEIPITAKQRQAKRDKKIQELFDTLEIRGNLQKYYAIG